MLSDHVGNRLSDHDSLTLFVDGGCQPQNPGGIVTAGWLLVDPSDPQTVLVEEGKIAQKGGPLATNNFGEYSALIFALTFLNERKWRGELTIMADSKLLIEQCKGTWKVKAPHLAKLRQQVWSLMEQLELQRISEDYCLADDGKHPCFLTWVPREKNQRADHLCHVAHQEHLAG